MLVQSNGERAETLLKQAKQDVLTHWNRYQQLAALPQNSGAKEKK